MRAPGLVFLLPLLAVAQTPASVQATGSATVYVAPDQAQLTAGVITQAATAQAAAEQNATSTTAMLNALKAVLGVNGTIQTVGYSISPRYSNANPPVITGYTASNTVQITTVNLNLVGPLIDAANQARKGLEDRARACSRHRAGNRPENWVRDFRNRRRGGCPL
jgi:uncharacterized protein